MTPKNSAPGEDRTPDAAQRRAQQDGVERIIRRGPAHAGEDAERQAIRQRQLDALRGMATIRLDTFPATTPGEPPDPAAVAERKRQIRLQLTPNQRLITGIRTGFGMLPVERWTGTPATGWAMENYNLELQNGRPFGALFYRADDGRTVRVAVRWDYDDEQLEAAALHDAEPRLADTITATERDDLERDTRGRVGALIAANAAVGSFVATPEAEDGLLDAAGIARDEPETEN